MEVTSGVLVYMRHIRKARLCADGTKAWFRLQGIPMQRLRDGLPVEVLEATGDKFALTVAAIARNERG